MIKIESLHIEEFRGIRSLKIEPNGESFVVYGPNGSGKSGIVDAIDFALTGNVARLSGAGTGGISLTKHAPHVTQRDNPAVARVTLGFRDTLTGTSGTLTRCVKTPGEYELTPATADLTKVVAWSYEHPELTLSRREIIRFVVVEAGKRAQEVQALLKLDRLDATRKLLKSALTKTASVQTRAKSERENSEDALKRHLDLPQLGANAVTTSINSRRMTLGLEPFEAVTIDAEVAAGVDSDAAPMPFDKDTALRDLQELNRRFDPDLGALPRALQALEVATTAVTDDDTLSDAVRHRAFLESGISIIDSAACPLCDTTWPDEEQLRAHVRAKLDRAATAEQARSAIRATANAARAELAAARDVVATAARLARDLGEQELPARLQAWATDMTTIEGALTTVEGALSAASELEARVTTPFSTVSAEIDRVVGLVQAKPDLRATAEATRFLTVASERIARVRVARAAAKRADAAHDAAQAVYDAYCESADGVLSLLYAEVESEFGEYYRRINTGDEDAFKAALQPAAGKLDLLVDFYGMGMFPPAAYHSEGHQDGMGVCLYLALMRRQLGDGFKLAILDDVVMSVDSNHRRQFCQLLKDKFPDTQFIITTHDDVWAKQIQTSGLVSRKMQARFFGWTVEDGPHFDQGQDAWVRLAEDLKKNDVPAAAHKLRRYLESTLADIAEALVGSVPYRPDGKYDLSELLDSVKARHGSLLKKAQQAAQSWGDSDAEVAVAAMKTKREDAMLAQSSEQWAINALVHYNEWAAMSVADFMPVVDAWKAFLALFSCDAAKCESLLRLVGRPGSEEALRCDCAKINLNLRPKK